MTSLIRLGLTFLLGILLYLACFSFFIHKPLTIGITFDYFKAKSAYLKKIGDKKKIVILAGSNGRFSHRCEVIEKQIGVYCANLSIAAGTDLYYQLKQYDSFIKSGDIIYMPLEYRSNENLSDWSIGNEGPLLAYYDHKFLWEFGLKKAVASLFYFDIRFLISGISEMILDTLGKKRRFGTYTLTEQGDEFGHNLNRAMAYRQYVKGLKSPAIDSDALGNEKNWGDLLKILSWANDHGVTVVGGLPTVFNDTIISNETIDAYKKIFTTRGHRFLQLDNKSQYPKDLFYDTPYHLCEEGQIQHSVDVSKDLQKMFPSFTDPNR